jgi:hypothetical protein
MLFLLVAGFAIASIPVGAWRAVILLAVAALFTVALRGALKELQR